MNRRQIQKFTLQTIAEAVRGSDLLSARSALAFAVGAVLDVSGTVRKFAKREGVCRLVIEPGDVPGFIVFADCPGELENLRKAKIRKGSAVAVRGKLQSFGVRAVCLFDCSVRKSAHKKREVIGKFGKIGNPKKT